MGEYEEVSIELGEVKRQLTKRRNDTLYLLELLRRCVVAFRVEEKYHSELYDYDLLEEVEKELKLWKTERSTHEQ
jgi:hypothetical protein